MNTPNYRIQALESALAKEIERQARIDALPNLSEFSDDTVIFFKYTFPSGGMKYTYTALKVRGSWYTSGPQSAGRAYSDDELRAWLASGTVSELWVAAEWEQEL